MRYTYIDSPLGKLLVAGEGGALCAIRFESEGERATPDPEWQPDDGTLEEILRQLNEYFDGRRREFELRLEPTGTDFQRDVWRALCDIPFGETISYGELADRVGRPSAQRAVGAANGRNPIPIVVPCHRVIGSNGKLTGYGGGLPIKEWLLTHEQATEGRWLGPPP